VVDDDRGRQRAEEVPQLGQIDRLEVDHHVPAERCDSTGDLNQLVLRREVHQPPDEVEAHAAHAGSVRLLQTLVGHRSSDSRYPARPAARMHERIAIARLSAPWQVACTTTFRAKPR
jgi:hypothetical protein